MVIPHADYILDGKGQKVFVKLTIDDWENFVKSYQEMEALIALDNNVKSDIKEEPEIQNGYPPYRSFSHFLDEQTTLMICNW